VFDDNSDDGTQEIVKACPKAVLEKYPFSGGLDDREFIQHAQDTYRKARGHADWVIWCDSDELLYHPQLLPTLEKLLKDGVDVPLTRGFQMISETFPQAKPARLAHCPRCGLPPIHVSDSNDYCGGCGWLQEHNQITDLVTDGVEDPTYAKPLIFRPSAEVFWEPGKHYVHGTFKRSGDVGLQVLHYRCLGLDYLRERHQRNYSRCSKANIASGLGIGVYPGFTGHMSEPWFAAILPQRKHVVDAPPSKFDELVKSIHLGVNPYEGYLESPMKAPVSHWGQWGSDHPWLVEMVESTRPGLIIEVGSFLGGSAIAMGEKLRALGLKDSAILCVDTWLAEEILWSRAEHRDKLKIQFGSPCFYYTFLSNILDKGLQDTVLPLRMPSFSAARYLASLGITAKAIYIDGTHIEGDVMCDLNLYWDRLEPGGVMLIDDYVPDSPDRWLFEGVIRDTQKFAAQRNLKLEASGNKARFRKA
jgi:hypothetical protein